MTYDQTGFLDSSGPRAQEWCYLPWALLLHQPSRQSPIDISTGQSALGRFSVESVPADDSRFYQLTIKVDQGNELLLMPQTTGLRSVAPLGIVRKLEGNLFKKAIPGPCVSRQPSHLAISKAPRTMELRLYTFQIFQPVIILSRCRETSAWLRAYSHALWPTECGPYVSLFKGLNTTV